MSTRRCAGFTLIELVVAIVIIGVGVAGVMVAFSSSVRGSGDALVNKQMLAVGEEMMEEILLKTFAVQTNGTSSGTCGGAASRDAFNDVRDYNNYQTSGIYDAEGCAVSGLGSYGVVVKVLNPSAAWNGIVSTDVLQVNVTVTHGSQSMTLTGFRTNYAGLP